MFTIKGLGIGSFFFGLLLSASPSAGGAQLPLNASPGASTRPVSAVQILNSPTPAYSEACRQQGIEGSVLVKTLFGADNTIKATKVISGPACLHELAVEAVGRFKFVPAKTADGRPVDQWKTVSVAFKLREAPKSEDSAPEMMGTVAPTPKDDSTTPEMSDAAVPGDGWRTYVEPNGRFAVSLPGEPLPAPEAHRAHFEQLKGAFVAAVYDDVVVSVFEMPANLPNDPSLVQAGLDMALDGGIRRAGAVREGAFRSVEHWGLVGREAVTAKGPDKRRGIFRAFANGGRVICVIAQVSDSPSSKAAAERFFASLKFPAS